MQVRHAVTIGLAGLGLLAVVATAPVLMGAKAGPADLAQLEKAQAAVQSDAKMQAEKKAQAEHQGQAEAKDKAKIVVREKSGPVVVEVGEEGDDQKRIVVRGGPGPFWVGEGGPRLGVQIRDTAKDDVAKYKLSSQAGVVVEEVTKESAAEKAGVKAGDVVVQFDGENIRSAAHLTRLVRETAPGRAAKMAVMRDGKRVDLDVTPSAGGDAMTFVIDRDRLRGDVEKEMQALHEELGDLQIERRAMPHGEMAPRAPMPPGAPLGPGGPMRWRMERPEGGALRFFGEGEGPMALAFGMARGRLGVTVQDLTPELATFFGVKDGVLVSSVQADTPAAKAGLKAGDIITTIGDKAITSPGELIDALRGKDGEVSIGVTRDKKTMSLKATIEKPKPPVAIGRTPA